MIIADVFIDCSVESSPSCDFSKRKEKQKKWLIGTWNGLWRLQFTRTRFERCGGRNSFENDTQRLENAGRWLAGKRLVIRDDRLWRLTIPFSPSHRQLMSFPTLFSYNCVDLRRCCEFGSSTFHPEALHTRTMVCAMYLVSRSIERWRMVSSILDTGQARVASGLGRIHG